MNSITVGEARTLWSEWEDSHGDPVDPASVGIVIRGPDDSLYTPTPTNPEVGRYEVLMSFNDTGNWYWEWTGSTSEGTKKCRGSVCVVESWVLVPTSP